MKTGITLIIYILLISTAQAQMVDQTNDKVQTLIKRLQLQPHIEGGFFKETYQSDLSTPTPWHQTRSLNTAIYYLLRSQDFSTWHRLKSDEIWHFYTGTTATIYEIDQNGQLHNAILGDPLADKAATPQIVVPKDTWFAVKVNQPDSFILVGCTMSPGFDYHDFEIGKRQALLAKYPQYETLIKELTRA